MVTAEIAMFPPQVNQQLVETALSPFESVQTLPGKKVLFREGDTPQGVWFLHDGEVDLVFASPRSGEAKALLVAEPGQLLGLTCIVSGRAHDCTATTRTPSVAGFIDRERFLKLLDQQPALWLSVLQMISTNINACWDCMRSLGAAVGR